MNKIKLTLTAASLAILLLPVMALAQMERVGQGGVGAPTDLPTIIHKIENAVGLVFGAIAVITFIIAGILFLTAGGIPEKVATARQAFLWGVAGVVVGIIAFSIIAIVASVMGAGV